MLYIKRITALLLCLFCLSSCFRGASEQTVADSVTDAVSHAESSSADTEAADVTAPETEPDMTETTAEAETLAETTEVLTEDSMTEPAVPETEAETEAETEPTPETEAVPVPETEAATEAESAPTVENNTAPAPAEGQITYIDGILVVNKTYALPADYNPGVDPTAQDALWTMIAAASADGLSIWARSGFRSYNDQLWQYNVYVERDGAALADTYSARPGHSEHQSGLAFDMNSLDRSFAYTAEGLWIAENCYKYGFIIRYPEGKEDITGYMYEPWHVRYVGVELATEIHAAGVCLEEYFGITSRYAE